QDARSMLVQLTAPGLALINRAVDVFVEHERRILSLIPADVLNELDENLARLLLALEGQPGAAG
ncbi:MAG: MarR family transcriptional regulator, partial [Kerstersia sp.]